MEIEELFYRWESLTFPERSIELDMGCGAGSFAEALARRYPERLVLASDVMIGRLRKVAARFERALAAGIPLHGRILRVESRHLVGRLLPDGSVDRIHLLCPDPWPKDRHRAHRLMAADFMAQLHRVLKADGIFHFSSDDEPYAESVARTVAESKLFADAPEGIADVAGMQTDFERRWLAQDKRVRHLAFRRLPLPPKSIGH